MCLGIPMQVLEVDGLVAWCEGRGRRERLNIILLEDVALGDWVYAVLGQAREKLTLERVTEINLALDGLTAALNGETNLDAYFPNLKTY
ncbi:MAG: HypC/HybG/HupF family hydrogenase formation chaperone [Gallionellaceae bacterium]